MRLTGVSSCSRSSSPPSSTSISLIVHPTVDIFPVLPFCGVSILTHSLHSYSIVTNGSRTANYDSWSGYRAQRDGILAHLQDNKINNTVILSGDSHATWVSDLRRDNQTDYDAASGYGSLGVEFAGSAVSSPSSFGYGPTFDAKRYVGIAKQLVDATPSLQFSEGELRGYFELTYVSLVSRFNLSH